MPWNSLKQSSRQRLDARFAEFPSAERFAVPPKGWIKAVRTALGLSTRQLGNRVGKRSQSILELEKNEALGRIQIDSLAQLALALDCQLVYAFIPNNKEKSLRKIVETRARKVALKALAAVNTTMALEDQAIDLKDELRIQYYIQENLDERSLWDAKVDP
ncbi:mobile mystery protein A [Ferrovibrio sp.]|uniref:mobile mystery protein A n=1 Tax=Ferrovibrio sp. TaxID=1917215 RepID=UPI0035120131